MTVPSLNQRKSDSSSTVCWNFLHRMREYTVSKNSRRTSSSSLCSRDNFIAFILPENNGVKQRDQNLYKYPENWSKFHITQLRTIISVCRVGTIVSCYHRSSFIVHLGSSSLLQLNQYSKSHLNSTGEVGCSQYTNQFCQRPWTSLALYEAEMLVQVIT